MTEDEAKTKWCPFARVLAQDAKKSVQGAAAANRLFWIDVRRAEPARGSECIASACMAWRKPSPVPVEGYQEQDGTSVVTRWQSAPEGDGHCGLAGQP